jgi:hypothetical protein
VILDKTKFAVSGSEVASFILVVFDIPTIGDFK